MSSYHEVVRFIHPIVENEQEIARHVLVTILVTLFGVLLHYVSFGALITIFSLLLIVIFGIYVGFKLSLKLCKEVEPKRRIVELNKHVLNEMKYVESLEVKWNKTNVVFTKNVDIAISEIMDLTIQDCVLNWYKDLVPNTEAISPLLKNDLWLIMESVRNRIENIDEVKFLTKNVTNRVCEHFRKLQFVLSGELKTFELNSYLINEAKEMEYLQNISEFLLVILLPENYVKCLPLRKLLREILNRLVLYPTIDMMCDPDYINQKLLTYLEHQARMLDEHNRTYAYAASYEDFIQMIYKCSTVEDLKQMRYKIMTEIMHATTINNLKKAKGMDADKQFNPQGKGKADLLEARHLPRYINQLTFGKAQCEKLMKSLGGPDYLSTNNTFHDEDVEQNQNIPGKKILLLPVILDSSFACQYLLLFLKQHDCQSLLEFWKDVNEMKEVERNRRHFLANEIFKNHINNQSSAIRLSKSIVKGMEAFLVADKGPDSFFEAQDEIYDQIQQKWYPAFIVSRIYHEMITIAHEQGIDFLQSQKSDLSDDSVDGMSQISGDQILFSDHSSYAKSKLDQISDKLVDKISALQAVSMNLKGDQKVKNKLKMEIESLRKEESSLSLHIDRTEVWSENLGSWVANIHTVQEILEDEKLVPHFVIVIHLQHEEPIVSPQDRKSNIWLVSRELGEFHSIHAKLLPAAPWLKSVNLPSQNKWFKAFNAGNQLEKSRTKLQDFLEQVMRNDQLNKSEALYTFLSPTPEYLKIANYSSQKSKFSLSNIFNRSLLNDENAEDDEYLFFDEYDIKEDKKDSIAEHLYALIGEIFELHGLFKWLRKTLIMFVQVSFGSSINRQIRETISWLFSEQMLLYYLDTFKESMWPDGRLAPPWPARTTEEKQQTRINAKAQLLNSIPTVLSNLVGQQNARHGAIKIFEVLQDKQLNKQLVYNILEDFITEFAPELNNNFLY